MNRQHVLPSKLAALSLGLVALMPIRPAHAQTTTALDKPSPRQGYYLSAGLHATSQFIWKDSDAQGARSSIGNTLRLGEMLTSRFGLGLLIGFTNADTAEDTAFMGGLSLEGQARVWRNLAVHAATGLGFVQLTEKNPVNPDDASEGVGGAMYTLGVSYDFFPYRKALSGGLSLSPTLRMHYIPGDALDGLAVFAGLDVIWWTGIPKNQLDLPPDRAF